MTMTMDTTELLDALERHTTTTESRALLQALRGQLTELHDRLDGAEMAVSEAEERATTAHRILHEERQWQPSGVYLIERQEGQRSMTRLIARPDDLPAVLTEASVLQHREALTRAVRAVQHEMRASFKRDRAGNVVSYTLPAPADIVGRLVTELARALREERVS